MIEVHCTASLERLHSLGTDTLVIRANPRGGWSGYLDFLEVQFLDHKDTCGQIESSIYPPGKALAYPFLDGWDFLVMSFSPGILERP